MRPSVERDFTWQSQFVPPMKRIVGEYLIGEAPADEDRDHNTDLIVLRLEAIRVACRVRQHKYLERYGDEFTVRTARPSGSDTELSKLLAGWGDYVLYGFATEDSEGLAAWVLGDLSVFRLWHHRRLAVDGQAPGVTQNNGDGSSTFRAYRIDELPDDFVVARKTAFPPHWQVPF